MISSRIKRILLSLAAVVMIGSPAFAADAPAADEIKLAPDLKNIIFPDDKWTPIYETLEKSRNEYLAKDTKFDIPPPPANDSPETLEELKTLFKYAKDERNEDENAKIIGEQAGSYRELLLGLNDMLTPETQTKLDALTADSMFELDAFLYAIKREYKRPRPNQLAPELTTVIPNQGSASYPSGHAATAQLNARIFSYIDPANEAKYQQLSNDVAKRRAVAGIHFPSDCAAAQSLANQVFDRLVALPAYRARLDEIKKLYDTGINTQALRFEDSMWTDEIRGIASIEPIYVDKHAAFTLEPAPANDSEITKQDLATMHKYKDERRTPDQIALINEEAHEWKKLSLDPSVQVTPDMREKIEELVNRAVIDHGYFSFQQKKYYKRARPSQVDASIEPVIKVPAHPAYPSGHGGQTHIAALAYSYIDPAHKEFYMNLANDIGVRREIAGLHYPSDTKAGIALADQVFAKMMENPEFKTLIDEMRVAVQNANTQ